MKSNVRLLSTLSKILLGLSLITFTTLYAKEKGSIESSVKNYVKLYESMLYKTIQENGIEIDESASPKQESLDLVMPSLLNKANKQPYLYPRKARKECESNEGIFLENKYVATCVTKDGTFGNGSHLLGMTFNSTGMGTVTTPDYLRPGSPWEFFSVSFNGSSYHNNNNNGGAIGGADNIPTKIAPLNRWIPSPFSGLSYHNGGVMTYSEIPKSGLKIIQKYTVDPTGREIIIRVEMYNSGEKPIEKLYYARGLDPDQDIPLTFSTLNIRGGIFSGLAPIDKNNIVQANGIYSKLSVALYSVDPIAHNTCISPSWIMDPQKIFLNRCYDYNSTPTPNYNHKDSTINIGFNLETLKPGEKKVFSFKYLFQKKN